MADTNRKKEDTYSSMDGRSNVAGLHGQAVAIDPPPAGAIGIQELLSRFERFAAAAELEDSPDAGAVGVRELLARLSHLADAGYFSPPEPEDPDRT